MIERVERKPTLKQKFKARSGMIFRLFVLRSITEIPLVFRALRAPDGEIVRESEIKAQGKIVDYGEGTHIILTDQGEMVFPNHEAGDIIRPLPHR